MKTVLLVPGFRDHQRDYAELIDMLRKKGYHVRFIRIEWNETTLDDWFKQALMVYVEYDPRDVILLGHSFGAIVALLLAAIRNPWALWLLSLSGRFAEDIPRMKPEMIKFLGPEIMEAFARCRFESLISKIACKVLLFFGSEEEEESPELVARVHETHAQLQAGRSKLIRVEGAGHDPTRPLYLKALACEA